MRFTNFYTHASCSPTRSMLLSGVDTHLNGLGNMDEWTAPNQRGLLGYEGSLNDRVATLPQLLKDAGYHTYMVGKWHLTKDSHNSDAGPFDSWPVQRGFDRFYGILDGFTNLHHPHRLIEDNHALDIDRYPEGYYFTDDITDRAISMIRSTKARWATSSRSAATR